MLSPTLPPAVFALAFVAALAACGVPPSEGGEEGEGEGEGEGENPPAPDPNRIACDQPAAFPRVLHAEDLPLDVHFQRAGQEDVAAEILAVLEEAWPAEIALGFRPPVDDAGACGDDGRFDAFIWEDNVEMFVDLIDYASDSGATYMVLDPWGPYGGGYLRSTLFHELNHAMQATDDWDEPGLIFEATAQLIEELFVPEAGTLVEVLEDFQGFPEWSIDRYDDYETWYMYGAALFLLYLDEERFDGDGTFLGAMWQRAQGEDDFEDALDAMLGALPEPSSFADEVVAFARWRFVEPPARGWPEPFVADNGANTSAMAYGTVYVTVPEGVSSASVSVDGTSARMQAFSVAGAGAGPAAPGTLDVTGAAVVAVTVLPRPGEEDAALRTDETFAVRVAFSK